MVYNNETERNELRSCVDHHDCSSFWRCLSRCESIKPRGKHFFYYLSNLYAVKKNIKVNQKALTKKNRLFSSAKMFISNYISHH